MTEAEKIMFAALSAIKARIEGDFDNEHLLAFGPLTQTTIHDCGEISRGALDKLKDIEPPGVRDWDFNNQTRVFSIRWEDNSLTEHRMVYPTPPEPTEKTGGEPKEETTNSKGYTVGCFAFHAGYPKSENPYAVGTQARADWSRGYNDSLEACLSETYQKRGETHPQNKRG